MKKCVTLIISLIILAACTERKENKQVEQLNNEKHKIVGTWKLFYGEIKEKDSVQIKDLSNTDFIKIINETHFAFFNQDKETGENFYGGGGTYSLDGNDYIERLNYVGVENVRGHEFPFTIEINGDTLIQYGLEEVKEANINRDIIEKYIRIK